MSHVLEHPPLVGVPRIRRLERDAAGPGREDDVDDVAERHVVVMGPFVVAPAQVHPRLLGRHARQRVVQRVDVQARHLPELLQAEVGELDVAAHAEVGTVDLEHEARGGDGLVLLAHRLGDGEQIGLVARIVVVVEEQRDDTGRGGGEKSRLPADGALQIVGVAPGRLRIADTDRPVAGRRATTRAAGITEHPRGHLGKLDEIAVLQRMALATEPVEAILDVGGVARLAHLAVVDEIDAGAHLLAHDLGHRRPDARVERGGIDGHAFFLGEHHPDEIGRARQAPRVRRQEPIGAAHVKLL